MPQPKPTSWPLRQFSLTDLKTLAHDKRYWSHQLSAALEVYGCTKPDNEDSREVKAVACATLAGLGLALHQHFGTAVEALGCAEHQSCIAAGLRAVDSGKAHTDKMETLARKTLS
jgi:hypothetical protein